MSSLMYTDSMSNIIIKGIPEDIYRQFKAKCVLEGKTLKEKLIDMIRRELEEKEK